MSRKVTWSQLHGATLVRIEVSWEDGSVVVHLRTGLPSLPQMRILGTSAVRVECPRRQLWGPSVAIDEVRERVSPTGATRRLEIALQSADTIVIEAASFRLESV